MAKNRECPIGLANRAQEGSKVTCTVVGPAAVVAEVKDPVKVPCPWSPARPPVPDPHTAVPENEGPMPVPTKDNDALPGPDPPVIVPVKLHFSWNSLEPSACISMFAAQLNVPEMPPAKVPTSLASMNKLPFAERTDVGVIVPA